MRVRLADWGAWGWFWRVLWQMERFWAGGSTVHGWQWEAGGFSSPPGPPELSGIAWEGIFEQEGGLSRSGGEGWGGIENRRLALRISTFYSGLTE